MIYDKDFLDQERICRKYGAAYLGLDEDKMIGVSDNLKSSAMPLNGLRHSQTDTTSGWYVWAGEYSSKSDFFKPMHLKHFVELYPNIVPYLGLPPGWRFLIDPDQGYEDVWQDNSLLEIEG